MFNGYVLLHINMLVYEWFVSKDKKIFNLKDIVTFDLINVMLNYKL